ncbi:hypothetical protein SCLCIDRAFT_1213518 [Scleroderma citrinum Foug A]|uniref:Uncharacterized protein n=1 Tax=Scleroderma citrinum Foug A TaxID=1036808 RepID=A0A0C3DU39_9AGAM|nr:hypothetical protein SCLCIDRAFT_1213518 [Scleroderma citrinum Foug A]
MTSAKYQRLEAKASTVSPSTNEPTDTSTSERTTLHFGWEFLGASPRVQSCEPSVLVGFH